MINEVTTNNTNYADHYELAAHRLLTEFYEESWDKVVSFFYNKCGDMVNAEDLAGQTFYRAAKAVSNRTLPIELNDIHGWMWTIVRNLWINRVRDTLRWPVERWDPGDFNRFRSFELSPEESLVLQEDREFFYQAIESLPEKYRRLVELRMNNVPHIEIGNLFFSHCDNPELAAKTAYHRAIASLRQFYQLYAA